MVPRDKRPSPEELEGYVLESPPEPDYTKVRLERGWWVRDFQRREEQNRGKQQGESQTLPGHDSEYDRFQSEGSKYGFNRTEFWNELQKGVSKAPPR